MLSPEARSLYTDAVTPPANMAFDKAIGTTFSLDPSILLSIPAHLADLGADKGEDDISMWEGLDRHSKNISVYAQRARIQVPSLASQVYGLVESMIHEVDLPSQGQFHPKMWLIRFIDKVSRNRPYLRLVFLSRNLTKDRSWDISLKLEGRPGPRNIAQSKNLADFIATLPQMAKNPVPDSHKEQASELALEARRTKWKPPPEFKSASFSFFNGRARTWFPPKCDRLAVISPFCSERALEQLSNLTPNEGNVLISRPETLSNLNKRILERFQCYTLADAAEADDGAAMDDMEDLSSSDMLGLHAKIYIFERGSETDLVIGSANATNAALVQSVNVETIATLTGKKIDIGGIDDLLDSEGAGLGRYIAPYSPDDDTTEVDLELKGAEEALELARKELGRADLQLRCKKIRGKPEWNVKMEGAVPHVEGVREIRAWPLSSPGEHRIKINCGDQKVLHDFGRFSPAFVTALIVFELRSNLKVPPLRFVLNLPIDGVPENRSDEIFSSVVDSSEKFFRYLRILLQENDEIRYGQPNTNHNIESAMWERRMASGDGVLEELTRVYAYDQTPLGEVDKAVKRLEHSKKADDVLSPEFQELWETFRQALKKP